MIYIYSNETETVTGNGLQNAVELFYFCNKIRARYSHLFRKLKEKSMRIDCLLLDDIVSGNDILGMVVALVLESYDSCSILNGLVH